MVGPQPKDLLLNGALGGGRLGADLLGPAMGGAAYEEADLEGCLETRGGGTIGRWQPRWLHLRGSVLEVYDMDTTLRERPLNRYALTATADLKLLDEKRELFFFVDGAKVRLRAQTEAAFHQWAAALLAASQPGSPLGASGAPPRQSAGSGGAGAPPAATDEILKYREATAEEAAGVDIFVQISSLHKIPRGPDAGQLGTYVVQGRWISRQGGPRSDEHKGKVCAENPAFEDCDVRQQFRLPGVPGVHVLILTVYRRGSCVGWCKLDINDTSHQEVRLHTLTNDQGQAAGAVKMRLRVVSTATTLSPMPTTYPGRVASTSSLTSPTGTIQGVNSASSLSSPTHTVQEPLSGSTSGATQGGQSPHSLAPKAPPGSPYNTTSPRARGPGSDGSLAPTRIAELYAMHEKKQQKLELERERLAEAEMQRIEEKREELRRNRPRPMASTGAGAAVSAGQRLFQEAQARERKREEQLRRREEEEEQNRLGAARQRVPSDSQELPSTPEHLWKKQQDWVMKRLLLAQDKELWRYALMWQAAGGQVEGSTFLDQATAIAAFQRRAVDAPGARRAVMLASFVAPGAQQPEEPPQAAGSLNGDGDSSGADGQTRSPNARTRAHKTDRSGKGQQRALPGFSEMKWAGPRSGSVYDEFIGWWQSNQAQEPCDATPAEPRKPNMQEVRKRHAEWMAKTGLPAGVEQVEVDILFHSSDEMPMSWTVNKHWFDRINQALGMRGMKLFKRPTRDDIVDVSFADGNRWGQQEMPQLFQMHHDGPPREAFPLRLKMSVRCREESQASRIVPVKVPQKLTEKSEQAAKRLYKERCGPGKRPGATLRQRKEFYKAKDADQSSAHAAGSIASPSYATDQMLITSTEDYCTQYGLVGTCVEFCGEVGMEYYDTGEVMRVFPGFPAHRSGVRPGWAMHLIDTSATSTVAQKWLIWKPELIELRITSFRKFKVFFALDRRSLKEVTFSPAPNKLGIHFDDNGRVTRVADEGQGKELGVEVGWVLNFIANSAWSSIVLSERMKGVSPFTVFFAVAERQEVRAREEPQQRLCARKQLYEEPSGKKPTRGSQHVGTFTFEPGFLGFEVDEIGRITSVSQSSQLKRCGIKVGWVVHLINGELHRDELLEEKVTGTEPFTLTFKDTVTLAFNPGTPGMTLDPGSGKVLAVQHSGQAKMMGVKAGWQLHLVNQDLFDSRQYNHCTEVGSPYHLTFKVNVRMDAFGAQAARSDIWLGRAGADSGGMNHPSSINHQQDYDASECLLTAVTLAMQARGGGDPTLGATAQKLKRVGGSKYLKEAADRFREAHEFCQESSDGYERLCQRPSQRMLNGSLQMETGVAAAQAATPHHSARPGSPRRPASPSRATSPGHKVAPARAPAAAFDPVRQLEDDLDALLATAERVQASLEDYFVGAQNQSVAVPTALLAYSSGPKTRERAEMKALVRYGAAGGLSHEHLVDLARVSLVFPSCSLLEACLERFARSSEFDVVHIRNYFNQPGRLGQRHVEVYIAVDVPGGEDGLELPHVCEVRFEESNFHHAANQAEAPLRAFYDLVREVCTPLNIREEAAEYLAHATLAAPQDQGVLRSFRRNFAANFGSPVHAWRYFSEGERFLPFERFREACISMKCGHQALEFWAALDPSLSGYVSLYDVDPEASVLLAKLHFRLNFTGVDLGRLLTLASGPERPVSKLAFRVALRRVGFGVAEADRTFRHLASQGEDFGVAALDIDWFNSLPEEVLDVDAVLLSPVRGGSSFAMMPPPAADQPLPPFRWVEPPPSSGYGDGCNRSFESLPAHCYSTFGEPWAWSPDRELALGISSPLTEEEEEEDEDLLLQSSTQSIPLQFQQGGAPSQALALEPPRPLRESAQRQTPPPAPSLPQPARREERLLSTPEVNSSGDDDAAALTRTAVARSAQEDALPQPPQQLPQKTEDPHAVPTASHSGAERPQQEEAAPPSPDATEAPSELPSPPEQAPQEVPPASPGAEEEEEEEEPAPQEAPAAPGSAPEQVDHEVQPEAREKEEEEDVEDEGDLPSGQDDIVTWPRQASSRPLTLTAPLRDLQGEQLDMHAYLTKKAIDGPNKIPKDRQELRQFLQQDLVEFTSSDTAAESNEPCTVFVCTIVDILADTCAVETAEQRDGAIWSDAMRKRCQKAARIVQEPGAGSSGGGGGGLQGTREASEPIFILCTGTSEGRFTWRVLMQAAGLQPPLSRMAGSEEGLAQLLRSANALYRKVKAAPMLFAATTAAKPESDEDDDSDGVSTPRSETADLRKGSQEPTAPASASASASASAAEPPPQQEEEEESAAAAGADNDGEKPRRPRVGRFTFANLGKAEQGEERREAKKRDWRKTCTPS